MCRSLFSTKGSRHSSNQGRSRSERREPSGNTLNEMYLDLFAIGKIDFDWRDQNHHVINGIAM